jgi:hypothetical protein
LDRVYTMLVRATVVAGILLTLITLWAMVSLGAMSLLPIVGLAATSAGYAGWRLNAARPEGL